jgi:hypothetical protein
MPKMICKCGNVLRYGEIPCKIEYKFISDVAYDKYQGNVDAEELYLRMNSFIECPICKTIWMFWNGFEDTPKEYVHVVD